MNENQWTEDAVLFMGLFGVYSHYGRSVYCTAAKMSLWFYKPLKVPTQPQNV